MSDALDLDALEAMSDEELLASAAKEGIDVKGEGERVRGVLLQALQRARDLARIRAGLECMICWDEGFRSGRITRLPAGQTPEFLALPEIVRARLSRETICPAHEEHAANWVVLPRAGYDEA